MMTKARTRAAQTLLAITLLSGAVPSGCGETTGEQIDRYRPAIDALRPDLKRVREAIDAGVPPTAATCALRGALVVDGWRPEYNASLMTYHALARLGERRPRDAGYEFDLLHSDPLWWTLYATLPASDVFRDGTAERDNFRAALAARYIVVVVAGAFGERTMSLDVHVFSLAGAKPECSFVVTADLGQKIGPDYEVVHVYRTPGGTPTRTVSSARSMEADALTKLARENVWRALSEQLGIAAPAPR